MHANLQAAEVLQTPQFGGAVCRGGGQHLVHGREGDGPDAAPVTPKYPQQGHGPLPRQGPQLGCAVLGARCQQLVIG